MEQPVSPGHTLAPFPASQTISTFAQRRELPFLTVCKNYAQNLGPDLGKHQEKASHFLTSLEMSVVC